jgi:hypothetical protein
MARRLSEPVRSLRSLRDTGPDQLERAVMRALARVPADRFRSVTAFRHFERLGDQFIWLRSGRMMGTKALAVTRSLRFRTRVAVQ